jgi:hypothetical protein
MMTAGGGTHQVTKTVTCPGCHAQAVLTFVIDQDGTAHPGHETVYLCPNVCAPSPHEISALVVDDSRASRTTDDSDQVR